MECNYEEAILLAFNKNSTSQLIGRSLFSRVVTFSAEKYYTLDATTAQAKST